MVFKLQCILLSLRKSFYERKLKQDGWLATHIFRPIAMFHDQLLKFFLQKTSVLNLSFKGFPQIFFPTLLFGFAGIINLSQLQTPAEKN